MLEVLSIRLEGENVNCSSGVCGIWDDFLCFEHLGFLAVAPEAPGVK